MLNQLQVQLQTSSIIKQPQNNISLIQQSLFILNCMCLYFTSMLHFAQGLNVKSWFCVVGLFFFWGEGCVAKCSWCAVNSTQITAWTQPTWAPTRLTLHSSSNEQRPWVQVNNLRESRGGLSQRQLEKVDLVSPSQWPNTKYNQYWGKYQELLLRAKYSVRRRIYFNTQFISFQKKKIKKEETQTATYKFTNSRLRSQHRSRPETQNKPNPSHSLIKKHTKQKSLKMSHLVDSHH